MRKVLIFKETLLPPSETFILAQMNALRHHQSKLAGLERSSPSLPLPEDPLLLTDRVQKLAPLRAKLYRKTNLAPLFHRHVAQFKPDLVHAHFASGGCTALSLARRLHLPLLVTLHGSDITVSSNHADRYSKLGRQATLFLCVSAFIRRRALQAGFPDEKLLVHYIGVDRNVFSPSPHSFASNTILFVGRLVEKKGCEYLLRSMQIVQKGNATASLTIVGDGPLRTDLEQLAQDLSLRCSFLGVQPPLAVQRLMRSARVFCLPSVTASNGDSEGLPTVLAEAQAMGLPVVATHHAGIPELAADGETALLVAERDSLALANALSRLLTDNTLWHRFHHAASERVAQHFDLKTQTALLEDLYMRVTRPAGTGEILAGLPN